MKRLTDPSFRYHNSADTDLRRTFARVRREQKRAKVAAVNESWRMVLVPNAEPFFITSTVDKKKASK